VIKVIAVGESLSLVSFLETDVTDSFMSCSMLKSANARAEGSAAVTLAAAQIGAIPRSQRKVLPVDRRYFIFQRLMIFSVFR
jgi:hypothetical protein